MSGPCVDAWAGGEPVLKPDLAAPILVRWPAFAVAGGRPGCYALEVLQELPQRWPLRGEDRSIVAEFLALHFVRSPAFSRLLEDIETNYGLALSPRRRRG